eukprot:2897917-Rhodomonas_salina.1
MAIMVEEQWQPYWRKPVVKSAMRSTNQSCTPTNMYTPNRCPRPQHAQDEREHDDDEEEVGG